MVVMAMAMAMTTTTMVVMMMIMMMMTWSDDDYGDDDEDNGDDDDDDNDDDAGDDDVILSLSRRMSHISHIHMYICQRNSARAKSNHIFFPRICKFQSITYLLPNPIISLQGHRYHRPTPVLMICLRSQICDHRTHHRLLIISLRDRDYHWCDPPPLSVPVISRHGQICHNPDLR